MFGLGARFNDYDYILRRHRLFETSWPVEQPLCEHKGRYAISVAGHGNPNSNSRFEVKARPDLRGPGYAKASREAMDINWMTRKEIAEAIPPPYTQYIGTSLIQHLMSTSKEAA